MRYRRFPCGLKILLFLAKNPSKTYNKLMATKRALIYQIYPTAFGDIPEMTRRLPEIAALKPNYIWISPFFLSPWHEGGYDVADYEQIDPRFGTIGDFKKLIKTAEKHGIKILLDLVINHTSTEHVWFQKSRLRDPWYKDYYVWLDKPLNWRSFFGGPAFDYDNMRGEYYLHLFDKSQPDLNFENPRVVREFKKIIKFWTNLGVAGFRVDSANVLSESKFRHGYLPQIPGFFFYFQTKSTVKTLEKIFADPKLFNVAEPVGGHFFSFRRSHELTNKAFEAIFNIGTLDVADTCFSNKSNPLPVNYRKWFKKLAAWTANEPKLSLVLESHDTPRAVSRFQADAKTLAMLQFLLPSNFPCIYQGQTIGTKNPKLGPKIEDYPGVQSRAIYHELIQKGKTEQEAIKIVQKVSRDNARQPIDWQEYDRQNQDTKSIHNFYLQITQLWRSDPIFINGTLKVRRMSRKGVFDFERHYGERRYQVHLDFSGKTPSTLKNDSGEILLSSR